MKKNVLHLIPSFHQGGSERQAVQLVKLLVDEGSYNISIACLDRNGILFDDVKKLGFVDVPEYTLSSFYDLNMARQLRRFSKYLRSNRIDIIQTHDFYSNIFGMFGAKLAGCPIRIAAKRETGMRSSRQLFIERRAFGLADTVVVNSARVKDYLAASGVATDKISVIYNGIDASRFDGVSADRDGLRRELNLPSEYRFVTIVANLRSPVKDHAMFLKAALSVAKKVPDAGFIVAGEGDLLDQTKQLAANLGLSDRTFFIGRCTRVPELLWVSEVCVLSSVSEGFSNSIIEYMAAGKPVAATDVGGASEAIVEGETGYLVESGDSELLADRVSSLLLDPSLAEKLGCEGRKRVTEVFSTKAQLEKTLAVYQRELSRKGA
ncbi:MAG: glycosyltransferase [Acidobacteria bacterium]|nr:glycosyltransferase [Acidobacteriota bacterium]